VLGLLGNLLNEGIDPHHDLGFIVAGGVNHIALEKERRHVQFLLQGVLEF